MLQINFSTGVAAFAQSKLGEPALEGAGSVVAMANVNAGSQIAVRMNLADLDLFAGVAAHGAVVTTPFSADFSDGLSMIAAVGLTFARYVLAQFRAQILSHPVPAAIALKKCIVYYGITDCGWDAHR